MLLIEEKTQMIIRCFYKVYNTLGYGFQEKVYENALVIELKKEGLKCFQQSAIEVYYDNIIVGTYFTDIVVDNEVIVEIKAVEGEIIKQHELQLQNYLKATDLEVGLVLNFGKTPSFKRKSIHES